MCRLHASITARSNTLVCTNPGRLYSSLSSLPPLSCSHVLPFTPNFVSFSFFVPLSHAVLHFLILFITFLSTPLSVCSLVFDCVFLLNFSIYRRLILLIPYPKEITNSFYSRTQKAFTLMTQEDFPC
ncbi:hypothetical protein L2E82_06580 [Cichorium intybus]|uniref:Uncharacterized protein n=1 Tax=Cichorium intybus TaxID=13427 RepID=A0ACB9HAW1_CICIN|nr:hypothetical protein L2E82_06580 [Cichorium intybus]